MVIARRSFWGLFFGTVPAHRARDPIIITPPPNLEKYTLVSFFFSFLAALAAKSRESREIKMPNCVFQNSIMFFKIRRGVLYLPGLGCGGRVLCQRTKNMCPKRTFAKNLYNVTLKAKGPKATRGLRIGVQVCRSAMHFVLNHQMDTNTIVSMFG